MPASAVYAVSSSALMRPVVVGGVLIGMATARLTGVTSGGLVSLVSGYQTKVDSSDARTESSVLNDAAMPRGPHGLHSNRPSASLGTLTARVTLPLAGTGSVRGALVIRSPKALSSSGSSHLVSAVREVSARSARKTSTVPAGTAVAVSLVRVTLSCSGSPRFRMDEPLGASDNVTASSSVAASTVAGIAPSATAAGAEPARTGHSTRGAQSSAASRRRRGLGSAGRRVLFGSASMYGILRR
jgi:hypothetical protein